MKRLILCMLLAALVAPVVIGQRTDDIIIGVVTNHLEARVWNVQYYTNPMNGDLQVLPVDPTLATSRELPTVEPVHYLVDIREANTAADQIAAIDALLEAGVQGLVITPVEEFNLVKDKIASAAGQVPVVLHGRNIPELGLPFSGFDMAEFGKAMAEQQDRGPFVLIGNMSDPTQSAFIAPHESLPDFKGFYEALSDGQAEAAMAIRDVADLGYIMVTHHRYAAGAAAAIQAATAGSDRLIRLGSVWAPEGWKDLFGQKLLHGVFTWDNYEALMQAAVMVKVMIRDGATPANFYSDVLYYTSVTSYNHTSHPYSQDTPNRIGGFW